MNSSRIRTSLRGGLRTLVPVLAASGLAFAHDFWIQPSAWRADSGERISLELRVGHPGESDAVPRDPRLFRRFFARNSAASVPADTAVVGVDGRSPAGYARLKGAGSWRVAYESEPRWIELEAEKFERYLAHEGLEAIAAERAALDESETPGRELYSRCAVTLLQVRGETSTDAPLQTKPADQAAPDRLGEFGIPLGLPLEIVAERDPTMLSPGDPLPLRILRRGVPIEGVLLCLDPLTPDPELSRNARSDARGLVSFQVPAAGGWLVTAVDMERAPDDVRVRQDQGADWISCWASLAFEIPVPSKVAENE